MSPRLRPSGHRSASVARRLRFEPLETRVCLAAVPAFSSLPGADHTIYLDFDGHTTQGTTWNSAYNISTIVSPAYDIDGNTSTFNATELSLIETSWKWIAEDFAPFEINVTTVDPGAAALSDSGGGDSQWGVRVVITNDTFANCGCGGHAYVGSFDDSQDEPVFVYNTSLTGVAEASTHEVGHALGLRHDGDSDGTYYWGHGSGETSWGPLMGASYNRSVTQWSQGEYYTANRFEDDLAIISSLNNGNGFGYRADDHGDTNAAATVISGTNISDSGRIETTSDIDVFSFTTGAGNVSINIDPADVGPNLDIKAELYDSDGGLVATSNPASVLAASVSLNLAAGQYYLHIDGTGTGDPLSSTPTGYTDYGSLGRYAISGTIVDAGNLPTLSIDDVAVNEADGTADFTVTLAGNVSDPVTVEFGTADNSAVAPSDYLTQSGLLSFNAAGTQTVTVTIFDDTDSEGDESFNLDLSNATNATLSDGRGVGTINDNDTSVSVGDVSSNEGNLSKGKKNNAAPQLKNFIFNITLSNPVAHSVTVDYVTADDTATIADNDYQAASGSVTFAAGETSKNVTVTVFGDNDQEPNETFALILNASQGANLGDPTGIGTILDDDTKGGGGGGGGGGKGRNRAPQEIELQDPIWWFEGPGDMHAQDQAHNQNRNHMQERILPLDGHANGVIIVSSRVALTDGTSRSDAWLNRIVQDDEADEIFESVDDALADMDFNGASEQPFISKLADRGNAASQETSGDEMDRELNDAILSEMHESLRELLKRYL